MTLNAWSGLPDPKMPSASTEQEHAEFEKLWAERPTYMGQGHQKELALHWWQAARRAQVVPHDRLRINPMSEPTAKYVYGDKEALADVVALSVALEQAKSMLAAAPQPPEEAPVQMPEPVAYMLLDKDDPEAGFIFAKDSSAEWHGSEPLYTKQQVRQLLADQGIKGIE